MAPVASDSLQAEAAPAEAASALNGKKHATANGHAPVHTKLGFATRALHVGSEPSSETGAVIPAISLSTTFKQDGVGNHKGFEYSRSGNPNRDAFERAIASLEGGAHGLAFSSGSAVTSTILSSLPPHAHVVSVNDVYGGTHRYFTRVANVAQHIETTFVDMDSDDALEQRLQDAVRPQSTKLVWIETPTNPTLRLVDIARVSALVKRLAPDARVVVDNTFLSPWYQQPLALGADIVVHSVTKYLNGHSDVVMGVAVTSDEAVAERLRFLQNAIGAVPSAFDCWLALRGVKTLAVRMKQHGHNALQVARWLEKSTLIESVIYPGLPSHASHAIARKQIHPQAVALSADGPVAAAGLGLPYGGMLSFRFASSPDSDVASSAFLASLRIFTLAESLGGVESLVELPSKMTHGGLTNEQRRALGIGHNFIRISVGLEEPADLIADLEQALLKAAKASAAVAAGGDW
ncbi:hypothetical protein K437DRAFT_259035 [Tilletiaria anomala UBC 951]|uniref:cystathionine gamma-lyase n=1 Tax=Tilletiaria anomala (strain ATCC 24038 / CBS 436.72 / UBC 951) TaxID=1037660 RepID=A0A066VCR5_TILAU|nr:uncharacterized protein K437DRAFT_259035 [Tilletiaria anomala UBC 951]KDN39542.1 hypothetical protein K437DRAFT_259035 [Tilletiaria anomala UBC 951]